MKPKQTKKQPKQYIDQNPIEALRSIPAAFKKSAKNDLLEGSVHDAWEQIVNPQSISEPKSGELTAGEELNFENLEKRTVQISEAGRYYVQEIVKAGERGDAKSTREIEVRMQEILIEIMKLSKSSKELEKKVQITAIEQEIVDPGVYHANWFESILLNLRNIRATVEDGLAWFSALRSKKASRQYGVLAKKHGTSFSLSHERVVATQTG